MSEKDRAYYAAHRDQRRATGIQCYYKHRKERLEKRKAYYQANRERCLEWWRAYRNTPRGKAYCRAAGQIRYARTRALWAVDAAIYAEARLKGRIYKAKKAIAQGRVYIPQPARRIPDWCVMDAAVDVRSQWLVENLTPSQRAYARELAIERNRPK